MRKYDMKICSCGRIHMINMEKIDNACEVNKNLLLICAGCGRAVLIGADIEPDWEEPDKECYEMYTRDFSRYSDSVINSCAFEESEGKKAIDEIIYSHGYKVPMKTGQYATDYFRGRFSDRWYPDFYKIQRENITVPEIMDFIEEYTHDRTTVDMQRFIYQTPEDVVEEISHYWIEGLDWTGTKWEQKN